MKKYIKNISICLFLILSIFIIAFNNFDDTKENELLDKNIKEDKLDKFSIPVQHYSKNSTKNVSHKLDSLLNRINKRHDFHGAVLVAKNKKIVYQNQVGYADFRKKTPLNSESVFQLASVSKQFTAAAIMQLKEKSKLKLTDSVNAYFPDFPYKNITIRNLLNHTSGLPKYFWVAEHEWKENKPPTNKDLIEVLPISKAQRFFKPGRNFDYSNTGYFVLASIIEKHQQPNTRPCTSYLWTSNNLCNNKIKNNY